ncbi:TraR/DksA family transcriptional regulator [Streptomyces europaeiscabiei]|uniref:TraR/DksA family transcriptional regulator n=2 Tax=Streptomyces TaxID=1883 RepID=UPI0029BA7141|nr:TraR/DksA family transcriptional regulator [Streptomyces europaeiscabiei]MDX3581475.1 TraR/DksA family transcriptional regulator [Streptomyces europaeiscabiei]MDX3618052.1 TraR/DksA family transcriptional regulator [Streptomyces europaeiscabiei]MDX3632965.1 TraR/DksA family transcriptional regulator [Streptomyces europaeiscabiei]MDX3650526.1 TraR/DksA family transcriptional regulator [Streptomyces europaeiscabiei]WUD32096.1 TraR/DksA family transcriptional regulator [Streptomyces europaeisc
MVAKKTAEQQSASGRSTVASGGGGEGEKAVAVKAAGTKRVAKKAVAKKAEAEKTVVRKTAVKKTAARRATTASKAAAAEPAVAEKTAAGKSAVGSTAKSAAKSPSAKKSMVKKAGAAEAAETTGATTVVAKNTPGTATAAKRKPSAVPKARPAAVEPGELAVRPGEDPWSPEEVTEARTELQSEAMRLRAELEASERSLTGLMRDSGDGAGDDQADTGAKNITREHELSLAHNAREMLDQTERALDRLASGTYGLCENCGNAIGKARMQAFPRATLCVECKQKQERR